MFGIGMSELLLILVLALIVIGPNKLPDIARALGRGFAEFRKATDDLKRSFSEEVNTAEARDRLLQEGKIRSPGHAPEDAVVIDDSAGASEPAATAPAAESASDAPADQKASLSETKTDASQSHPKDPVHD